MTKKKERPIWYQLEENNLLRAKKETPKAFEAFTVYLNIENGRSIQKASQMLSKSSGTLKRWAKVFKWQKRANAFDKWKFDQESINREKRLQDDAKLNNEIWLQRRSEIRNFEYEEGMKLLGVCEDYLDSVSENLFTPIFSKKETRKKLDKEGELKETIEITTFESGISLLDMICNSLETTFEVLHNSTNLPIENLSYVQTAKLTFNSDNSHKKFLKLNFEEREKILKEIDNKIEKIKNELERKKQVKV